MGEHQIDVNEMEAKALAGYLKEIETMVSMPELYRTNYPGWSRMVNDTLRYPSIYPTDEKIDWALIYQYEVVRATPKHMLDLFVTIQKDVTPAWERSGDMNTEGYMKVYGVDRPTALKIRSLYERRVILEPEWIKAK